MHATRFPKRGVTAVAMLDQGQGYQQGWQNGEGAGEDLVLCIFKELGVLPAEAIKEKIRQVFKRRLRRERERE